MSDETIAATPAAPEASPAPAPEASTPDPAPAAPETKPNASLLDDPTAGASTPTAPQSFPDDWREQMAGEDDKALNQLKRFKSPQTLLKSYQEAQKRISEGVKPLAVNADSTPEELAAYRKQMNIPEEASGYGLKFQNEQLQEISGEALGSFQEMAHERNMTPEVAQAAVEWFEEYQTGLDQQRTENAFNIRQQTQQELMQELGGEYNSTVSAISAYLESSLTAEGKSALLQQRFEDGSFLGDNPYFLRMMADVARDHVGPDAIFTGDVETVSQDVQAEIDKMMEMIGPKATRQSRAEYKTPENQEKLQKLFERKKRLDEKRGR